MYIFLHVRSSENVINKVRYLVKENLQKHKKREKTTLLDCKGPYFSHVNNVRNLASRCSDASVKLSFQNMQKHTAGSFICRYLLKKYSENSVLSFQLNAKK